MKELSKIENRLMLIDGIVYYIENYEQGYKEGFKKGKLYYDELTKCALPYRGKYEKGIERPCGIYQVSKKDNRYITVFPNKEERRIYTTENIKSIQSIFKSGEFIENDLILDVDGESFKPPIYINDDMMLKLVKAGITLKNVSFSTYDNRFQRMDIGTNSYNRKSNAKKAILNNNSLSSTKALQFGEVMDFDIAIMIKNKPNIQCPMQLEDDRPLVIYSGREFDTSNPIKMNEVIDKLVLSDDSEDGK